MHSRDRAIALAIAAGAIAYLLPLRHYGLTISDDGWLLSSVLRMLDGEVLYRDVWVFYAPLRYHVVAGLFALFEPSLLLLRGLWVVLLTATAIGLYRLARRLAPPSLAWLPAVVYPLAPGPWHKSPYGFCTVFFFLALARALERPRRRRLLVLGAVAGLVLVTRQELGLAACGLALAAVAARHLLEPGVATAWRARLRPALREVGLVLGAIALAALPLPLYYASQGALGALLEAVFYRAFVQMRGNRSDLPGLLSSGGLPSAFEGSGVTLVLLAPLLLYPVAAWLWLRRARRGRVELLPAALGLFAIATLPQAFAPALLIRFLQSALPFYLLATWVGAAAADALRRRHPARAGLVPAALAALAGLYVWGVVDGLPRVLPDREFTGSVRMRLHADAVQVLGDETRVSWRRAEEIRLLRNFFEQNAADQTTLFAAPLLSGYYPVLGLANPTRYTIEHVHAGDWAMSDAMKREAMDALLASPTRHALALRYWWRSEQPADVVLETLRERFRPVREYESVIVLTRDDAPEARHFGEVHRRVMRGEGRPDDLATVERYRRAFPDEPLAHEVRAALRFQLGRLSLALDDLREAARLDPANPLPRERAAEILFDLGRLREAAEELARAAAVRESPRQVRLRRRLPPDLRADLERRRRGAGPTAP
ncbi:MAG: hypothetical protein QNK03_22565 [Myxococcota bacterium]|nr:hypothetical protein [Myxococcota bacterium]